MPDFEFKKHPSGLHYWDPRESKIGNVFANLEIEEEIPDGNILVNTVQENMTRYSNRDVKKATEDRRLHGTLHFPSKQTFDWMIKGNQIKNCKATPDHVEIAHNIWVESEDYLKGSRVQSKSNNVDGFKLKVPTEYLKLGK